MENPSTPDLEELYTAHASALFAFLLNATRDEGLTRDLIQEIFCQIAARPELLIDVRNTRGWMMRNGWRRFIDHTRRTKVRHAYAHSSQPALFAESTDPDEAIFRESLTSALAELPRDQRAVVHLKLSDQLTFAEIAEILDISPNTAASRYRYGIDKLRTLLRPIYEELK